MNKVAEKYGITIFTNPNFLTLHSVDQGLKNDGSPYLVFGSYMKNASKLGVPKPIKCPKLNFLQVASKFIFNLKNSCEFFDYNEDMLKNNIVAREYAKKILNNIEDFSDYDS
jgi:hypothetical protein